jgi:biotin operon repressor
MTRTGKKYAHHRYSWYDLIVAAGLYDHVGLAHALAGKFEFVATGEQLAGHLKTSLSTVERQIRKLRESRLLKVKSGKAGRVVNEYELLFNPVKIDGVEGVEGGATPSKMTGQPRQKRRVNPVKFDGPTPSKMTDLYPSSSSQESSQGLSEESPPSNCRVGEKKGRPSKIKNEIADKGSFEPHPGPVQESTTPTEARTLSEARTPTKAKQIGNGFDDDDDEISRLLNEFSIDDPTYRQLKKLKGREASAILKLASKKTNPKGYILITIQNAERDLAAAERLKKQHENSRREFIRLFDADRDEGNPDPSLKALRKTIWNTFRDRRDDDPQELWEKYLKQKQELADNPPYEDEVSFPDGVNGESTF